MLEMLPTADDVIAIKVEGVISCAELQPLMDKLEKALAAHDKVHVFVETHAISGIDLKGFPDYMRRAMPLFGKLGRFGRVAVVADQAWIRLGTRIESAILPFIDYQVYEPDLRDEAFAWVVGSTS